MCPSRRRRSSCRATAARLPKEMNTTLDNLTAQRRVPPMSPSRSAMAGRTRRCPARARIRRGVGDLCAVRRARGVAARRAECRRQADEASGGWPGYSTSGDQQRGQGSATGSGRMSSARYRAFPTSGPPGMGLSDGADDFQFLRSRISHSSPSPSGVRRSFLLPRLLP